MGIVLEFSKLRLAAPDPVDDWQFLAGRFTGSDRDDVAGYNSRTGDLRVWRNDGGGNFVELGWTIPAPLAPADGWQIVAGNFAGTDLTDLAGYHPSNGTLWVFRNLGGEFAYENWTGASPLAPVDSWQIVAGSFAGSRRTDLAGYHPSNNTVWIFENLGGTFGRSNQSTLSNREQWQLKSIVLDEDGVTDLVAYDPRTGELSTLASEDGFDPEPGATVSPPDAWAFVAGRFEPELGADGLLGYASINGSWWMGRPTVEMQAYCWPLSRSSGEQVDLYASISDDEVVVDIVRHSFNNDRGIIDQVVPGAAISGLQFQRQAIPPGANENGCGWTSTGSATTGAGWKSGIYSVRMREGTRSKYAPFVVRPAPAQRSKLAVLVNVNTWNAYNTSGGPSSYRNAGSGSFLRPASSSTPARPSGSDHLLPGELFVQGWLDNERFNADYYTDLDLHDGTLDLPHYDCLLIHTHPEYWTIQMYERLVAFLGAGGSLLYLGGNGIFEIVELDASGTRLLFRDGRPHSRRSAALFRTNGRPERQILGVATEACGVVPAPYQILVPDHPFIRPTGLQAGSELGRRSVNRFRGGRGASGWETDTSVGAGALGLPTQCGAASSSGGEQIETGSLAASHQILARAPGANGAELTVYETHQGGLVLSAGSIMFGGALHTDPNVGLIIKAALAQTGVVPQ